MAAAAIHFQILHNKGLPHIPPLIAAIVWEITMRKNLIYFKQIWSDSYKQTSHFYFNSPQNRAGMVFLVFSPLVFLIRQDTMTSQVQLAHKRVFEHTYSDHIRSFPAFPFLLRQSGIFYILKIPFYPVASLREVFQ